jgi:GAF domain-containing protein
VIQITRAETRGDTRELFDETETLSLVSVPMMVNGAIWVALGFDDCSCERVWDEMEIELLKSATALIAEAIGTACAAQKLRTDRRDAVMLTKLHRAGARRQLMRRQRRYDAAKTPKTRRQRQNAVNRSSQFTA